VFVKVCGITNGEDAKTAVRCGVSALGFVFCPSPRRVTPEKARAIRAGLPAHVRAVGVFTDESALRIREVAVYCGLDLVQLHGDQSPETCRALGVPCIRAFRIRDETVIPTILRFHAAVYAVLLDGWDLEKAGGTGRSFDWELVPRAGRLGARVILAGGLTPENVALAVARTRPHGVDVSSGVERRLGIKDPALVRRFIAQARRSRPRETIHV